MKEGSTERIKKLLFDRIIKQKCIYRDSKYGEFIFQANAVQSHLTFLLVLRVLTHTEKFIEYLEEMSLGSIVRGFQNCSNSDEKSLVKALDLYNKNRNRLAHKMMNPKKRLTEIECESSIKLGEKILKDLKEKTKSRLGIKSIYERKN